MKKNIVIPLVLVIWIVIVLVIASMVETKRDEKLNITTSFYPMYVATLNITDGVEGVEVTNLTKGTTSCLHEYSLTTEEMVSLVDSDVLVINGAGMEGFLSNVISNYSNLEIIDSSKGINLLEMECHHNHEHTHEETYNSHIFVSVANYIKQITELDNDFSAFFDTVENKTMIFGDRFPFVYFTHQYGISYASAFPGCADHSEPSATQIADLIKKIDSEKISTVYYIEFSNQNIAKTLSDATGAKTALFYSCHNVSKEQLNNGTTYVSLMRENLNTLKNTMK